MLHVEPAGKNDSRHLAPLIYSSGPAAFDYVFLHRGLDFLNANLLLPHSSFSHSAHWVAREQPDGEAIGCASLFTRAQHDQRHNANIAAIVRWAGWRSPLMLVRGLKVESLIPAPPASTLHIAHLGVAPTRRGQGIGARLIELAVEQAQTQQIDRLSLDVSAENPRAQALYQRLGFEVKRTQKCKIPGLADHHYMEKRLA